MRALCPGWRIKVSSTLLQDTLTILSPAKCSSTFYWRASPKRLTVGSLATAGQSVNAPAACIKWCPCFQNPYFPPTPPSCHMHLIARMLQIAPRLGLNRSPRWLVNCSFSWCKGEWAVTLGGTVYAALSKYVDLSLYMACLKTWTGLCDRDGSSRLRMQLSDPSAFGGSGHRLLVMQQRTPQPGSLETEISTDKALTTINKVPY